MSRAIIPLAVLFVPVLVGIFTGNLHAWYGFIHGPEPAEGHLKHLWHVKHAVLRDAVLPRAARALLRRLDRLLGRDAELVHAAGRRRRRGPHAKDALVGAVRRAPARR